MSFESKLTFHGDTDVGVQRNENQDNWGYHPPEKTGGAGWIYIVADGMGGARGGRVASQIAVDVIRDEYRRIMAASPDGGIFDAIRQAVNTANARIHERAEDPDTYGMGTTVTVLVVRGDLAYTAHVGDSRIYRFRDGRLEQMTRDHTRVQELVDQGIITPGKAKRHPQGHIIARNLGGGEAVEVDIPPDGPFRLRDGDVFLLCSDGLYGLVDDEAIRQVMRMAPPDRATPALISLANRKGGHDNITVCAVCAGEEPPMWKVFDQRALDELIDRLALDDTSDTAVFNVAARDALQPTDFETEEIMVTAETREQLEKDLAELEARDRDKAAAKAVAAAPPPTVPPAPSPAAEPTTAAPDLQKSASADSSASRSRPASETRTRKRRRRKKKKRPWLLMLLLMGLVGAIVLVIVGIVYLVLERQLIDTSGLDGLLGEQPAEQSTELETTKKKKSKKSSPADKATVAANKAERAKNKTNKDTEEGEADPDEPTAERDETEEDEDVGAEVDPVPIGCAALETLRSADLVPYHIKVMGKMDGASHVLVSLNVDEAAPLACRTDIEETVHLPADRSLIRFRLAQDGEDARECKPRFKKGGPPTPIELDCG